MPLQHALTLLTIVQFYATDKGRKMCETANLNRWMFDEIPDRRYMPSTTPYVSISCEQNFKTTGTAHRQLHPFNGLFQGLPRWAATRKVKPISILLKQETVSGNGISWAICKSAPHTRQITTPAPHHSVFLQAGCPSCRPTNSVKALKA